MTIETFNKTTLRMIQNDLDAALAALSAKHGIKIEAQTMRYTASTFKTTVEGALPSSSGAVDPRRVRQEENFKTLATALGIHADTLGKTVHFKGVPYTVTGIETRSYKNPVVIKNAAGKFFKIPVVEIMNALARAKK